MWPDRCPAAPLYASRLPCLGRKVDALLDGGRQLSAHRLKVLLLKRAQARQWQELCAAAGVPRAAGGVRSAEGGASARYGTTLRRAAATLHPASPWMPSEPSRSWLAKKGRPVTRVLAT